MIQTINLWDFRNAFDNAGRSKQFTYEAQEVLFNFIENCERDIGEQFELDIIGLCCDFAEMDLRELITQYPDILEDTEHNELTADNEAELLELATDFLHCETMLCGLTPQNTFVFKQF